ncbi:MAG: pyroglutamyl-peptidase I [Clostridia bacterium]|nr:pyroglutamyl-peptidase I [Clostridia bacterium]
MKKLLITGFEPFGGEEINPSWEAVSLLPDRIGSCELTKLRIPVVFGETAETVIQKAEELQPDIILCIGQAGGREGITPELVGINLRYAKIPDNKGNQPKDEPIIPKGKTAYFSTLPVRNIAEEIQKSGVNAQVSYSAGVYVCNDLLYTLLARFENSPVRVGFIHVPYCETQNKQPSLPLSDIVKGLTVAIKTL